jgi:TDG/mug DNA glycosylase family protein
LTEQQSRRSLRYELGAGRPTFELPLALANLHFLLSPGDWVSCILKPILDDGWSPERAIDLIIGAGFTPVGTPVVDGSSIVIEASRIRSLPDSVAPGMRLLIVGLNPSPYSADHAIGYARPGNRFWPAALKAGLVNVDRDPQHALHHHGLGMTDLVRRTTARADQVERAEFVSGFERVERLAAWLQPKAACFIGLGGWRAVIGRKAIAGVQERTLGGRPVYVMPHTSGLNAHCRLGDLVAHLCAAAELADGS